MEYLIPDNTTETTMLNTMMHPISAALHFGTHTVIPLLESVPKMNFMEILHGCEPYALYTCLAVGASYFLYRKIYPTPTAPQITLTLKEQQDSAYQEKVKTKLKKISPLLTEFETRMDKIKYNQVLVADQADYNQCETSFCALSDLKTCLDYTCTTREEAINTLVINPDPAAYQRLNNDAQKTAEQQGIDDFFAQIDAAHLQCSKDIGIVKKVALHAI